MKHLSSLLVVVLVLYLSSIIRSIPALFTTLYLEAPPWSFCEFTLLHQSFGFQLLSFTPNCVCFSTMLLKKHGRLTSNFYSFVWVYSCKPLSIGCLFHWMDHLGHHREEERVQNPAIRELGRAQCLLLQTQSLTNKSRSWPGAPMLCFATLRQVLWYVMYSSCQTRNIHHTCGRLWTRRNVDPYFLLLQYALAVWSLLFLPLMELQQGGVGCCVAGLAGWVCGVCSW